MFTNNFLKFTFIVSVLFTIDVVLQQAESSMLNSHYGDNSYQYPIVYQRFIRRRPPMHLHDQYMEEIREIFHTKEKPPSGDRTAMSDEDIDKFIFCDFNRHLDECKSYWESRKRPIIARPTTISNPQSSGRKTMTDEEVDKFIFCDFNRHLDECKSYWESRKTPIIARPTTTKTSLIETSTTLKSTTTTSDSPSTTEFFGIPHLVNNENNENIDEDLDVEEEKEYNDYEYDE
ncbi:uncharacterized protein LOC119612079 [Lucilia sericata]|uniref:uncharacterized protein LOC119612079 n=1 Tax=Lucilia sericata TaxID=13632 RepID=UPI0018A80883|nr:uncharacterized protein LOC119612079 [Lucilia sericata]